MRKMRSILPCGWPLIGERGSPSAAMRLVPVAAARNTSAVA